MLREIGKRGQDLGFSLEFDPSVPRFLAEESFEKALGARPLRRALTRHVEDPLSLALVEGRILRGDRVLCRLDESSRKVILTPERTQPSLHAAGVGKE